MTPFDRGYLDHMLEELRRLPLSGAEISRIVLAEAQKLGRLSDAEVIAYLREHGLPVVL